LTVNRFIEEPPDFDPLVEYRWRDIIANIC
jgi:hypothetical protein